MELHEISFINLLEGIIRSVLMSSDDLNRHRRNIDKISRVRAAAETTPDGDGGQSGRASVPVYMRQPELLHGLTFLGVRSDHELAVLDLTTDPPAPLRVLYEKRSTSPDSLGHVTEECQFRISRASLVNPLTGADVPVIVSDSLPFNHSRSEFYCGYGAATDLDKKISDICGFKIIDVLLGCTQKYIDEQNAAILDIETNSTDGGNSTGKNSPESVTRTNKIDFQAPYSNASHNLKSVSSIGDGHSTTTSTAANFNSEEAGPCCAYDPSLQNSAGLTGLRCSAARAEVLRLLHERRAGGFMSSPHLKDWLISRQVSLLLCL
ncbi:hypothetical protein FHG87_022820 [Trinorchestia longiramus]|nr:hypothetical protein FHG87_022820 [Trinorchestia longiramus]